VSKMHQRTNRISAFIPLFISPFQGQMSRSAVPVVCSLWSQLLVVLNSWPYPQLGSWTRRAFGQRCGTCSAGFQPVGTSAQSCEGIFR
jgi:hypothetical protein